MTNHFQILIVGGGNAGLSVASQLLRKNARLQIGIIDPADKHYYQPAWTLVGAGIFDIKKTERDQKDFIPKGTTWIKEAVTAFAPEQNQVSTTLGNTYSYDALIVCPGIQLDWAKIAGLKESLGRNNVSSNYSFGHAAYTWEMIKNFKGGTAIFTNPSSPIKCGGAPHKIMYLAVDYWRKKGILDKCNVHYLSGSSIIFGIKEYAATLEGVVRRGHIQTHFGVNVVAVEGANRRISFETKEPSVQQIEASFKDCNIFQIEEKDADTKVVSLEFDFCHSVPPQSAPDFIKRSTLADAANIYGYVEVDKNTMQHTRFKNVFSLGDCSSAPCSKTGAAIRKQAPVVVANVISFLEGKMPVAKYEGYSACPIPTEYGKLMLAEFDYSNKPTMTFPFNQAIPRWSMWILKTKILPWLYWNRILSGKA
ncbi:MAG: NAD(P)/FAD-dependent oxidoreductase [Bacteroidetes bacterium]|nr:NAD(P)/FAD-dependent oxidoreductase [Bacteroidota bacterium]